MSNNLLNELSALRSDSPPIMSPGDVARNLIERLETQEDSVLILATDVKRVGITGVCVKYIVLSLSTQRIYTCYESDMYDHAYLTLNA